MGAIRNGLRVLLTKQGSYQLKSAGEVDVFSFVLDNTIEKLEKHWFM
jgi:hypothetical protein